MPSQTDAIQAERERLLNLIAQCGPDSEKASRARGRWLLALVLGLAAAALLTALYLLAPKTDARAVSDVRQVAKL